MLTLFVLCAINQATFRPQVPSVDCGSNVSLIFKAFEVMFDVPSRDQCGLMCHPGTWAMVYTVVLFSKPFALLISVSSAHAELGRCQDFIYRPEGYFSPLFMIPDFSYSLWP